MVSISQLSHFRQQVIKYSLKKGVTAASKYFGLFLFFITESATYR